MPTAVMLGSNTDIANFWNTFCLLSELQQKNYLYEKAAACRDTEETHRKVGD